MPMGNMQQAGSSIMGGGEAGYSRFRAKTFLVSQRYRDLDRRQSYYDCTQNDYKRFDFEGRVISSGGGISATQPLMSSEKFSQYIPLRSRRPSAPIRLARSIVNTFTNLVFGEGRFPTFHVDGDDQTQDFIQTLVRQMSLPVKMIQARNLGGSVGTVGISWCFLEGKPRCEVHNAKFCYVHEWTDREQTIPRHVTELKTGPVDEWDPQKQQIVRNIYWYRRDWTPNVDIIFVPALDVPGQDPIFKPDLARSEEHNDGIIHFEWIQNTPTDDIDGLPDYEGLYEPFDALDLLASVIMKGATLNLDPTLKLKMDPDIVNRMGIKKGSDNALITGKDGDADYLELGGQSIEAGIKLLEAKRRAILEAARCVIPNSEEATANGTSSVAMKMLYAPSLGVTDILREQYAKPMVHMLEGMTQVARIASKSTVSVYNDLGEEEEVQRVLALPPRIEHVPAPPRPSPPPAPEPGEEPDESNEPDPDQNKPPEEQVNKVERTPGEGGEIETQWGPYFMPTPSDQSAVITTLNMANGGQPLMSQQTSVEIAMQVFGRPVQDEQQRVAQETAQQKADQMQQAQAAGIGGGQPGQDGLPPGAKKKPPGGGGGSPPGGGGGGGGGADTQSGKSFGPDAEV
jgi:hypothetical protein